MVYDLEQHLDPEHDAIKTDFIPEWYVVEVVGNNSRNTIAAFAEDANPADIIRYIKSGEEKRYLIHA